MALLFSQCTIGFLLLYGHYNLIDSFKIVQNFVGQGHFLWSPHLSIVGFMNAYTNAETPFYICLLLIFIVFSYKLKYCMDFPLLLILSKSLKGFQINHRCISYISHKKDISNIYENFCPDKHVSVMISAKMYGNFLYIRGTE